MLWAFKVLNPNFDRGCVTPAVVENWKEESGGDPDMLDGYEDLSAESKKKIDVALEEGRVADEDWKGVSAVLTS